MKPRCLFAPSQSIGPVLVIVVMSVVRAMASASSPATSPGKEPENGAPTAIAPPSPIQLPDGEQGIGFDDLRFSPTLGRVLAPSGRTGRLNLIDPARRSIESIEGFSSESGAFAGGHGKGTTSADFGHGWIFASDRSLKSVVIVDPKAKRIVGKVPLGGGPDYVRWVEPLAEVWVTEPGRKVIEYFKLDDGASSEMPHGVSGSESGRTPGSKSGRASGSVPSGATSSTSVSGVSGNPPRLLRVGEIEVADGPESLAIDTTRGRAYTHTWHDATIAIDLKTHRAVARWPNGCEGARGVALDEKRGLLFVGCEEGKATALDVAHDGKRTGNAETGKGVDIIAYSERLRHLYVPGGDSATLAILSVSPAGELKGLGTVQAAPDAHCATADDLGNVYVCDPGKGRLLVFADPFPRTE